MHRIAELIALADAPMRLASGMLALGTGHRLARTDIARGLRVHAVRRSKPPAQWRVGSGRVIRTTERNVRAQGRLAWALQVRSLARDATCAAVAAMDACVEAHLPPAGAGAAHA